jgi:Phage tail tube protein, TTP
MATVRKWANVAVVFQSALAAADTVTAITKANPGVATATAHGFVNGDFVLLTVQGMYQVDGKVVRVANKTNDTFELEGINTTTYETFSSGTAELITFGNSITTATSMSATGGDFDFIDTTTIHMNRKTQIPGLSNPETYTFDNLWDIADAGQVAMKAASDAQAQRAFKFTFGTGGPIMVFTGYVGFTGAPGGNAQDKVTSSASITAFGTPTYYSA